MNDYTETELSDNFILLEVVKKKIKFIIEKYYCHYYYYCERRTEQWSL